MDMSDEGRDISVLFGDGAGAVVVEACEVEDPRQDAHILSSHLHADGRHAKELWLNAPASAVEGPRITHEMIERGDHYPYMNGKMVFVNASKRMPESVHEACAHNGYEVDDVDLFLFHQANLRINEFVAQKLDIPAEKVLNNIQRLGNCSAAALPILLAEASRDDRLAPGTVVSLTAFGSGFTWGSAVLRCG
jgi:3-oxoacyl-[acyl-carrier-protein] synthase-3